MNRSARRLTMLLVLAALPLAAREARADKESDAKSAYAKGREHFKAGKYHEAIAELKKAYALKPHPALLRYMGDTYYKMNKARLAIDHYKKYLKEAPEAPDKDKIESKVRQLELIVGAGDDDKGTAPPPPPPGPDPDQPATSGAKTKIDLQPTGEDREVPVALAKRPAARSATPVGETDQPSKRRALPILKWTALAVGVAGMAVGGTFYGLARNKAKELEEAARSDLPEACAANPAASGCGGNPDMNTPVVVFNKHHYDLQQSVKTSNTIGTAMMMTGGALLATSVVLFVVDRKGDASREKRTTSLWQRLQIAPVVAAGSFGLAGEVGF